MGKGGEKENMNIYFMSSCRRDGEKAGGAGGAGVSYRMSGGMTERQSGSHGLAVVAFCYFASDGIFCSTCGHDFVGN